MSTSKKQKLSTATKEKDESFVTAVVNKFRRKLSDKNSEISQA